MVQRELHDRDDAEDVVQTAFLDAQRALQRGTIPRNPRAWLAAIALNAARRVRHRHANVEALEEYAVQEASRLPEIKAALAGLPKGEQAAVLYRDVLGLSYAEMAEQMDRTVPAVTMLLHRARSRLRGVLGIALVGGGLWRWLRGSEWEATAANAVGVAVLAGGLATAGVVTGGHTARAAAPPARTTAAATYPRHELAALTTDDRVVPTHANRPERSTSTVRARTEQRSTVGAATATVAAAPPERPLPSMPPIRSQAPRSAAPAAPRSPLPPLSLPALSVPVPVPVLKPPASPLATPTATVATPVATATVALAPVTTPTVTTPIATVTTPITAVTVSIP